MALPIALQLYSLRDEMEKDFYATLEKVAEMGYEGVEFAGYFGQSAEEIKKALDRLGLKVAGSHIGYDQIFNHMDDVIAFEKAIGNKNVVCPWAAFETLDDWEKFSKDLAQAGRKLSEAGLRLVYHNHAREFEKFDDSYVMDMLMANSDGFYQAEIDVYFLKSLGIDPVSYLKKYQGRTPLIHVKDVDKSGEGSTEVGTGLLDVEGVVRQAIENKAEWLIVEQESFKGPAFEGVELSLRNLKKIILAV